MTMRMHYGVRRDAAEANAMAVGADRELVVGHDHGPTEYRYLERRKP